MICIYTFAQVLDLCTSSTTGKSQLAAATSRTPITIPATAAEDRSESRTDKDSHYH